MQAARSLFHIAGLHEKKYPISAAVLRQDFYEDDILTEAGTLAELNLKKTVTKILQLVGLSLSKWNSNHSSLQSKQTSEICIVC